MTGGHPGSRRYHSPAAFRDGLESHLAARARDRGIEIGRVRRQAAFERVLARLGTGGDWVLKGGLALELRLANRARATRDLDLATLNAVESGPAVRARLADALADDIDGDHFSFAVGDPVPIRADLAGRPGWRFSVAARLAGRTFVNVRLDVVARAEEISGGTERFRFPSTVAFAGYPPEITVEAIDLDQHAAEKLHALTRTYATRHNTRVKDLVDLVLLVENDLLDEDRLRHRVRTVFDVRATHPLPARLTAPEEWAEEYARFAADLDLAARTVADALACLTPFWRACVGPRGAATTDPSPEER